MAEKSNRGRYTSHENRIIQAAKVHDVQAHGMDKTKFIYTVTAATTIPMPEVKRCMLF